MTWKRQVDGRTYQTIGRSVVLFLSLSAASVLLAQLPTATILGVVKDSSGAVVPEATLTVRNVETGQTRTGVSSAGGSYRFSALPVGSYEIRVEHPGFRTEVRSGLTLTVGQEAVMNFTLEVGAVEQTVSVTAEAPLVNTTSGSLGSLVSQDTIVDLPLNGRNYIDLTLLQPGVVQRRVIGSATTLRGLWYSSNGATPHSNYYMLDGAPLQNLFGVNAASFSGSTLGIDGIREYRVITNSFSAEYGIKMGSQVVMVSKGGTNEFHGSAFEFLRNAALDARNFFDYKTLATPRRLPAFTRNNFGGSFGGPIRKDKTFFFGVYEGVRERKGITQVSNVIAPSAKVDGGAGGVPQIAPIIKPLLALFPDPNLPGNQYTFPFSQPTADNYGQIRLDQNFSANEFLFGRYTVDDAEQRGPLNYPQFQTIGLSRAQYATLSENHVFSPTLLNTFRFSYSRTKLKYDSPSGLSGPLYSFMPGKELGTISIGGVTTLTPEGNTPNHYKQNIFTWSDDAFYSRGRHALKFGTLINRFQQYLLNSAGGRGSVSFANLTTFLLAQPTTYSAVTVDSIRERTYHFTTLGFYAQDDLRLKPTLTLNLGLRYEFMTQIQEVQGYGSALRDWRRDAEFTLGPPFKSPNMPNFSPRFGFAWDVKGNGQMAVRGGFAMLYDIGDYAPSILSLNNSQQPFSKSSSYANPPTLTIPFFFPPGSLGKSFSSMDYNLEQSHMLQYNLTVERQLPFAMAVTLSYAGSRGINLMQASEGNPTIPQILPDGRQFWTGNESRFNPNWDTGSVKFAAGSSWYNSLQFGLTKRLSSGLQFQSSYTWSKLIDENIIGTPVEATGTSSTPSDPLHREVDRGLADFDITHNWRFNAIYRLPELIAGGRALGKVLNGWWMSGIVSLQSGYPFTPGLGTNRSRSKVGGGGGGIDRPDLVPGRNGSNIILGGPDRYFDPSAFTIPTAGFLGTAGRNILRGAGFANLDYSLVKDTALRFLGESGKLEFRVEFFNLLNQPIFSQPNRTVFAARADTETPLATVGVITATASPSRQLQFALKLLF